MLSRVKVTAKVLSYLPKRQSPVVVITTILIQVLWKGGVSLHAILVVEALCSFLWMMPDSQLF
jgi:hypothetical protein